MPFVVGKNVNFLPTKFIPKAGQIYFRLRAPGLNTVTSVYYISRFTNVTLCCINCVSGLLSYKASGTFIRGMSLKSG